MRFSTDIVIKELNKAQLTLHHAAQFIAISGKYLLEKKEDDSHTNMSWDAKTSTFYSGSINDRARVGLHVPSLSLKVSGPTGIELASLPLIGKTKQEGLVWLQQALQLKQIDTTSLKQEMHYDIPEHVTDSGKAFPKVDEKLLHELSNHRSIADDLCSSVFSNHPKASPPRTWPHHFDHGVYVPLEFDSNGTVIRSFSVGYAVADSVMNEPYFYVTQWKKDGEVDYSNTTKLKHGKWLPKKISGAALPISKIFKMDNQEEGIQDFINRTVEFSTSP